MLIKREKSKKMINSKDCIVQEYAFKSAILSFATAEIDGRYPDSGKVSNTQCEELYFVIGGTGIIFSEAGKVKISGGDLYHFKKGEKYYVEGKNLELAVINSPNWTPEQHILHKK